MSEPLSAMTGPVRALFSDIDGTLTTDGRLEVETYAALTSLVEMGIPVILVTGRPAGWGQALLSLTPITAIVTENGGLSFIRGESGEQRVYGLPVADLPDWRARMRAAVAEVERAVPGARLSSDSAYREVDLAIDWNEDVSLPIEDANRAVDILRAAGLRASRSSVHVNFCPPLFDKFTACQMLIERLFASGGRTDSQASEVSERADRQAGGAREPAGGASKRGSSADGSAADAAGDAGTAGLGSDELGRYVYVGDALNDAPMFAGFPRSIGVANVRAWWDELPAQPRYLTDSEEGAGVREVIARVRELGPELAP